MCLETSEGLAAIFRTEHFAVLRAWPKSGSPLCVTGTMKTGVVMFYL